MECTAPFTMFFDMGQVKKADLCIVLPLPFTDQALFHCLRHRMPTVVHWPACHYCMPILIYIYKHVREI